MITIPLILVSFTVSVKSTLLPYFFTVLDLKYKVGLMVAILFLVSNCFFIPRGFKRSFIPNATSITIKPVIKIGLKTVVRLIPTDLKATISLSPENRPIVINVANNILNGKLNIV